MDPKNKNLLYFNHFVWLNFSSSFVPFKLIDLTNSTFLFLASFEIPYRLKKLQKSRKTILKKYFTLMLLLLNVINSIMTKVFTAPYDFYRQSFLFLTYAISVGCRVFLCVANYWILLQNIFYLLRKLFFEKFSELRLKLNLHKPEKALNYRILWRSDFFLC